MPVTSEPVVIRVEVQDVNSGPVLTQTTRNLQQLGVAGAQAGVQVGAGLERAGAAAREAGGHFQTSFDQVRLLRTELGVQMPRAMESMIARSQALMGVVQSMGGVLAGVGFGMIAVSLGKELGNLYERWLDVDGAVRQYQQEAAKAASQKLFDEGAFETQIGMLKDLNGQIEALQSKRATGSLSNAANTFMQSGDWNYFSPEDAKQLGALIGQKQQNDLRMMDEGFRLQEQKLDTEMKRKEARVPEYQRPAIERDYARQRAVDERNLTYSRDLYLTDIWNQGHPDKKKSVPADDGFIKMQAQQDNADAEFNLKRVDRATQTESELARIHDQAIQSSLRGEALYNAKMGAEIDDLGRKGIATAQAVEDVKERYHNEEMARLREEQAQVAQRAREAGGAGLTGVERIRYEGETRDQVILAKAGAGGYQSLNDAQKDRVSNWQQTNAEILASEESFDQRVNQLIDESDQRQISGFARIRAEAKKQMDQWHAEFQKQYGTDPSNPDYAAHAWQLGAVDKSINAGADQQTADLARRNAEETEQIESAARVKLLSSEKQKTAAIAAEYEERVRRYQDALDQQEISQNDFDRRVVAAQMEAQAEMRQQSQETAQKIAGEMSSLFGAHPLEALERMGQKYAGEATAELLSRAMGGSPAQSGTNTSALASNGLAAIFMHAAAGPHGVAAGFPSFAPHLTAAAPSSIAQAAIHVDQGAIYISGGAGGYSSTARGFVSGGPNALPAGLPGAGGFGGSTAGGYSIGSLPSAGGVGGGVLDAAARTPVGAAPAGGPGALGYANTALRGVETARSIYDLVGRGNAAAAGLETSTANRTGGFNPDGAYNAGALPGSGGTTAWQSSMMGGGPTAANTIGAGTSAVGLYSAYKTGGAGGMMSGAMSGAQFGMAVGGPWGAAIGAAAGLAVGFMGGGEQARVWWLKNGQPRLANDMDGFQHGTMDYLSAAMDMQALGQEAKQTLDKMGWVGSRYYSDTAEPQISNAIDKLSREQKAGRSAATFSGAQYDIGSPWVPEDQIAKVHRGERIFTADHNERMTRAFEGGMAALSGGGGPRMAAAQNPPSDINLHFYSPDAKGARDLLMAHSETIRAALNKEYGDYGGMADMGA